MSTRSLAEFGGKKSKAAASHADSVDSALESALLAACADGDTDRVRDAVATIERRLAMIAPRAIEELVACAFARAARCNHVDTMALLLTLDRAFPSLQFAVLALRFDVCRCERLFPPLRHDLRCCCALRYVGYAAVACVEHNALRALRFLLDSALLDDSEVGRCFALAKQHAARFDAADPAEYRPMLLLLLTRFPLLLTLTSGAANAQSDNTNESDEVHDMRALESSLAYELALSGGSTA